MCRQHALRFGSALLRESSSELNLPRHRVVSTLEQVRWDEDTHDMGSEPSRTYSRVFSLRAVGQRSAKSKYGGSTVVDTYDVSRAFAST